jgi:hypothetical protein
MAIIQISKIQQRSGNLVDLPQLDEAQLGWANDAKRLFIGATGNTTTNVENVEVLTSYSTISFSQVEGSDGSNVNISNVTPGQILAYDSDINSWINTGGNTDVPNSPGSGIPIHLGTVSNVKMAGGATGYILETDGAGNLSWTSKGTLRTSIIGLSNATPVVMTVANTTPYTNGLEITITGANTSNSNIVNGQTFYVQVDANFTASNTTVGSGNVSLFTSSDLAPANAVVGTGLNTPNTYVLNSGVATASLAGGSASTPGGGNTQIQFNDGGILNGSANLVITGGNTVTLTGNFSASNVAGGNLVTANNITVSNISNLGAVGNVRITGGTAFDVLVTTDGAGNLAWGTIQFNSIYSGTSNVAVALDGNVTTSVGGVANVLTVTGTGANLTGTLSVSSNANVGNLGTGGLITATGNISGGNLISNGIITATGNVTAPNFIGNVVGNISGNLSVNGSNTEVIFNDSGLANANAGFTFNKATGLVSVTGNGTFGNVIGGNLVSATYLSGTLITGAQPNITSTGTLTSISVSGNANIGNFGTAGLITAVGNITGGNISGTLLTGTLVTTSQPNITTVGTLTSLQVSGNITPTADQVYNLGNATNAFKDLYLSGNTIYIGTSTITATNNGVVISTGNATPVTMKPAGANTQIQYNDDGAFGGQNTFTFNELTSTLTANNFIATSTANLGNAGNVKITGGTANYVLQTDGSGNLSWTAQTGGGNSTYGDSNVVTLLGTFGSNSISTTGNITAGNINTKFLLNSVQTGISAAGSDVSTATALGNTINIVTTVTSGTGVKLPSALAGMTVYITNTSANSLIIYPLTGAINSAAANFIQPANSTIHYIASSTTQWYTVGASMAMYT